MPTVSKPTRTSPRLLTSQRWEAVAAAQLRDELTLAARRADDWAIGEEMHRPAVADQLTELLATARRAGISLRVRPIGITRDGQIGLIQKAA